MALYQRRESGGRTRFLLALSLSTLTAIAVAAPLAIEAVRAEESTFAANDPLRGGGTAQADTGDELGANGDRSLDSNGDAMGGIGSRPQAKGQGQTSKTEGEDAPEPAAEVPAEDVLTNPDEDPEPTEPVEEPVEEEPAGPTTTAETVPEAEPTTTTEAESTTTTDPDESTTTTDPDESTTTTDPDESTTTTDPDESTTTTEDPAEPSDTDPSTTSADPPVAP